MRSWLVWSWSETMDILMMDHLSVWTKWKHCKRKKYVKRRNKNMLTKHMAPILLAPVSVVTGPTLILILVVLCFPNLPPTLPWPLSSCPPIPRPPMPYLYSMFASGSIAAGPIPPTPISPPSVPLNRPRHIQRQTMNRLKNSKYKTKHKTKLTGEGDFSIFSNMGVCMSV